MPEQTVSIKAVLIDKLSGPLAVVGKLFGQLKSSVNELGSRLAPLTGQVGSVVTAFVSLQAANKAIAEAEGAANAQRRLLNALRGNKEELERISKVAEGLGEKFALDDDDIVNLSATLINLGVSANDVDKNLEAIIRTSEATGLGLDAVTSAVAKFGDGEVGALGRIAGVGDELKRLGESGELASKGVDLLLDRFASAGEATDDFKEAARQTNALNNALGEQGKEFIKVKVAILTALVPAVQRLTAFLQSDTGQGILAVVIELAKEGIKLLPIVVGIAGAIQAIKVVAFLAPIVFLVAKIAIIGGLIAAIGAGLLEAFGLLDPILEFFGGIVDRVKAWFAEVVKGNTSVEDLFDLIKTRAAQFIIVIKNTVFDRISNYVRALFDLQAGLFKFVLGKIIEIGGSFGEFLGKPFDVVVRAIAKSIDFLTNRLADGIQSAAGFLGLSADFADSLRTDIESKLPSENIGKALKEAGASAAAEGFEQFSGAFTRAGSRQDADNLEAEKSVNELEAKFEKRRDERAKQREEKKAAEAAKEVAAEKKKNDLVIADQTRFEERLAEIRTGANEEARARARERALEDLKEQFDLEKITLEKFVDERRRLELEPLDEQIRKRQQVVTSIEAQIAKIREEKGANADVHVELEKLIDANLELQTAVEARTDLERDLAKFLSEERKKRAEEEKKEAEKAASDLVSKIRDARSKLATELANTKERRSSGFLFDDEAVAKDEAAIAKYKADFAELRQGLAAVLEQNPDVAESFAAVRAEIEGLGEVAREANETGLADLYKGFDAGATNAITRASDLREAGASLGESFAGAAGDIAVGFTEAEFSISNFFSSFLKQIGQALIKLAVFRSLASFFGIPTAVGGGALVQAANGGGPIIGLNDGGRVPGPLVNRDVVDAKLTPGEWVIQRPAVDYYGAAAMAAINSLALPRSFFANLRGLISAPPVNLSRHFAGGGQVNGIGERSTVTPAIVTDETTMERLLAGGGPALRRWMRDNSDGLRGDLGAAPL